jgi:hypothetical protein
MRLFYVCPAMKYPASSFPKRHTHALFNDTSLLPDIPISDLGPTQPAKALRHRAQKSMQNP